MDAETLSITLPADVTQIIREAVATGAYTSNSDVVQEAIRLWQDRCTNLNQRLANIRTKIEAAIEDPVRITDGEMRAHFERLTEEATQRRSA